ncbi:hypothetical protein HDU92_008933 [Lobulomyces angularis]|nr:hypothetical protein HDU92_008933 [Lobulomyces angularis]
MDCNLYELISKKSPIVTEEKAKVYMWHICKALEYIHGKGIFHRDIKPENILVRDGHLKIADFGSCRGIHSKQPFTEYIATRWYRSPECLLCDGMYNYKMDMWGAGCVLFEIVSRSPLFPGADELDQLHRIHSVLGTPSQKVLRHMLGHRINAMKYNFPPKDGTGIKCLIPNVTPECVDLINQLLAYDPDDRYSSKDALRHKFFDGLQIKETDKIFEENEQSLIKGNEKRKKSIVNMEVTVSNQSTVQNTTSQANNAYLKTNNQQVVKSTNEVTHTENPTISEPKTVTAVNPALPITENNQELNSQQNFSNNLTNNEEKKPSTEEINSHLKVDERQYPVIEKISIVEPTENSGELKQPPVEQNEVEPSTQKALITSNNPLPETNNNETEVKAPKPQVSQETEKPVVLPTVNFSKQITQNKVINPQQQNATQPLLQQQPDVLKLPQLANGNSFDPSNNGNNNSKRINRQQSQDQVQQQPPIAQRRMRRRHDSPKANVQQMGKRRLGDVDDASNNWNNGFGVVGKHAQVATTKVIYNLTYYFFF